MRQMSVKRKGRGKKKGKSNKNEVNQVQQQQQLQQQTLPPPQQPSQPLVFRRLTGEGGPQYETFMDPYQERAYRQGGNMPMGPPMSQPPSFNNGNQQMFMNNQATEDLEGTMANERDPFWVRRKFTREDSFPELKHLDLNNWEGDRTVKEREISFNGNTQQMPPIQPLRAQSMMPPQQQQYDMYQPSLVPRQPEPQAQMMPPNGFAPVFKTKAPDSGKMNNPGIMSPVSSMVPYPGAMLDNSARPSFESNNPTYLSAVDRQNKKKRKQKHKKADNSQDRMMSSNMPTQPSPNFGGQPQFTGAPLMQPFGAFTQMQQNRPKQSADASDMAVLMSTNYANTLARNRGDDRNNNRNVQSQMIAPGRSASQSQAFQSQAFRSPPTFNPTMPVQHYQPPNFANPYENITRPLQQQQGGPPPPPPKIRAERPMSHNQRNY